MRFQISVKMLLMQRLNGGKPTFAALSMACGFGFVRAAMAQQDLLLKVSRVASPLTSEFLASFVVQGRPQERRLFSGIVNQNGGTVLNVLQHPSTSLRRLPKTIKQRP